MTEQQTSNTTVFTWEGPQYLTDEQEKERELFKRTAARLFSGAAWTKAVTTLTRSGLERDVAEQTLCEAVSELIENGWEDYL